MAAVADRLAETPAVPPASIAELLDWRNATGAKVYRRDDGVYWVTPETGLTPALRAAIDAHQTTLAVFVASPPPPASVPASAAPAADAPRSVPPQAGPTAKTPARYSVERLAEFEAEKQALLGGLATPPASPPADGTMTSEAFFSELEKLKRSA